MKIYSSVELHVAAQPQRNFILREAKDLDCWLFTSLRTQPHSIVILSEAKDLDCWLFPHCPHNHSPLSS